MELNELIHGRAKIVVDKFGVLVWRVNGLVSLVTVYEELSNITSPFW